MEAICLWSKKTCFDVRQNAIKYKLSLEFFSKYEENLNIVFSVR